MKSACCGSLFFAPEQISAEKYCEAPEIPNIPLPPQLQTPVEINLLPESPSSLSGSIETKVETPVAQIRVPQESLQTPVDIKVSFKPRTALALGMVQLKDPESAHQTLLERGPLILPAATRDFYRLQALSNLYNGPIYTLSDVGHFDIGKNLSPMHYDACFGRRGALQLNRAFDDVFLDYVRFPSTYYDRAYGKLCDANNFVETMVRGKKLTPGAHIYVPQLLKRERLCENKLMKKYFNIERIGANQNPLYVATDKVSISPLDKLGGYRNPEIRQTLDPKFPFTRLTLK